MDQYHPTPTHALRRLAWWCELKMAWASIGWWSMKRRWRWRTIWAGRIDTATAFLKHPASSFSAHWTLTNSKRSGQWAVSSLLHGQSRRSVAFWKALIELYRFGIYQPDWSQIWESIRLKTGLESDRRLEMKIRLCSQNLKPRSKQCKSDNMTTNRKLFLFFIDWYHCCYQNSNHCSGKALAKNWLLMQRCQWWVDWRRSQKATIITVIRSRQLARVYPIV